ncbi:YiiX/YebB-like N1pC/P60 family cysteine hydrolase [Vibrio alginolyticus]|uniref:YiiX/YebB-like N1pC/P60 family cysteine hydrolase n=1 Tax=Vibrio alginolyticus TaxID=663 RepID=UPI003754FFEF
MIGDILLVRGGTKFSTSLVKAQKAIYKKVKSSHVEICVGEGIFIHSTNDGGVHLTFLLDELKEIKDDWKVIRLKGISSKEKDALQIASLYYLGQSYNKKYMLPENESSSFCSELIGKIYRKAGITILGGRKPSTVAPAHFDKEIDLGDSWDDVTHEYHPLIEDMRDKEKQYRLMFATIRAGIMKRSTLSAARKELFDTIHNLAGDIASPSMIQAIEDAKSKMAKERILDFWDEKDAIPFDSSTKGKKN